MNLLRNRSACACLVQYLRAASLLALFLRGGDSGCYKHTGQKSWIVVTTCRKKKVESTFTLDLEQTKENTQPRRACEKKSLSMIKGPARRSVQYVRLDDADIDNQLPADFGGDNLSRELVEEDCKGLGRGASPSCFLPLTSLPCNRYSFGSCGSPSALASR